MNRRFVFAATRAALAVPAAARATTLVHYAWLYSTSNYSNCRWSFPGGFPPQVGSYECFCQWDGFAARDYNSGSTAYPTDWDLRY
jgi:hypothetical protein